MGHWGSLTELLSENHNFAVKLNLINEQLQYLSLSDAQHLNCANRTCFNRRSVTLVDTKNSDDLVRADAILPVATLAAAGLPLRRLGQRPLGQWLFQQSGAIREQVWMRPGPPMLPWVRRSRFSTNAGMVLVDEAFSKTLITTLEAHQ